MRSYIYKILVIFLIATPLICESNTSIDRSAAASASLQSKMSIFRLPKTSKPVYYSLQIIPYYGTSSLFNGTVRITARIITETTEILLHAAKELIIKSVNMGCTASFKLDPDNEILRIQACRKLIANYTLELEISYSGLTNGTTGLYQGSYRQGRETKWVLATQFESTYARKAFPCYDEPEYRAQIQVNIARLSHQTSISNMPLLRSQYDTQISPRIWDVYYSTPPMATYLLAFAVFEYTCESNAENTIKVCTRDNAIGDALYAKRVSSRIVSFLEAYTNKTFSLPRLQLITIPMFTFTAMENWGLITFREMRMLFNEEVGSGKNLEVTTTVICHEISHQWFGDLVTPEWWDYVWLNEGFATFFEDLITDQIYPSWRMREFGVVNKIQTVLFEDQVRLYHPLTASVKTPKEIQDIFDHISYYKGAAILRMLEHMVSPEIFHDCIQEYLEKGSNDYKGTVSPQILFGIFDEKMKALRKPLYSTVTNIMNTWTLNPGYPLLQVSKTTTKNTVKIEQVPYKSPRSLVPSKSTSEWIVPVTYTRESYCDFNNTTPNFWIIPSNDGSMLGEILPPDEWMILNIQATGYYRVNYHLENWRLLILQLLQQHEKIHVLNRAQLIDDSTALAIDHYLPFHIPFELMTYLDAERDMIPWFSALNKLEYLYLLYETTEVGPLLKKYILQRLIHPYRRLGFGTKPTDDHLTKTGRSAILEMACRMEFSECVEESVLRYHKQAANLSKINPDIKKAVLCAAVNYLKKEPVWINLWSTYRKSNVGQEKETILYTLGCINDEEILSRYLYKLVDEKDQDISQPDLPSVSRAVFNRAKGINAGLQLMRRLLPAMMYGYLSERSVETAVKMLHFMKDRITTQKQVNTVEELITECEQWDDNISKEFMVALYSARQMGVKNRAYLELKKHELIEALTAEVPSSGCFIKKPSATITLLTSISAFILSCRWLSFVHFTLH